MPTDSPSDVKFEIGHVLFIDIVGYSKLRIDEQSDQIQMLRAIVRGTEQFKKAEAEGKLLRLPTGDGGALVFRNSLEAPVLCALEISKALKSHPELKVRMGIHSGPVNEITDLNEQANIAGVGINIAQRVMDCGDAGHILLSKRVADDLEEYPQWRSHLTLLGECEVKHGTRVSIVNLYTDDAGNRQRPHKLRAVEAAVPAAGHRTGGKRFIAGAIILCTLLVAATVWVIFSRHKGGTPSTASMSSSIRIAATIPEKSIAVLPFENLSGDPNNAYFAEGIQEEILTRLAKIADLKVISRTSTQKYKSAPDDLRGIAKQLDVANVLEGSVQKVADQVRVNVQLINAQTDSHLWADTYDRKLTDIFGVESDIARSIADSLRAKLTGTEEQALAVKPTNNPEAYDAYLRGLSAEAQQLHSVYASSDAAAFYQRAVELDPNFAVAWARLSRADSEMYSSPSDPTPARRDAAKRALETAQKLQSNSPETLLALARYQFLVLRDYPAAEATYLEVGKTLPGNSDVPWALAWMAKRQGRLDQASAYYEQALVLDPRNTDLLSFAAINYSDLRKFDAALKMCERGLEASPNDLDFMAAKASLYQAEGKIAAAGKLLQNVNAVTPSIIAVGAKITQFWLERDHSSAVAFLQARFAQHHFRSDLEKGIFRTVLAFSEHFAGDESAAKANAEQARDILASLRTSQPENSFAALWLSRAYALSGDKDSAYAEANHAKEKGGRLTAEENFAVIDSLVGDKADAVSILDRLLQVPYESAMYGTPVTPALLRLDPLWDPLRDDAGFQKLCQ